MHYISTRGESAPISFQQTVMTGLAPDKGLLVPEKICAVQDKLNDWQSLKFTDLAYEIISLYATDIPKKDLKQIIDKSFSTFNHKEITPVIKLKNINILELFHGPTLAFKDVALQFLGNIYAYILEKKGSKLNVLGTTSGDTGSAAIAGLRNKKNINVFIMYPKGRTSPLQELQMTSVLDKNIYNIAVEGSFDDCQTIMKDIFSELDFKKEHHLGSINSINWARILAQIVYYFYAYFRSTNSLKEKVNFSVPTGNFGDIFAGFFAKKMGLPINKLILATNDNRILADFFNKGIYKRGKVQKTISPSMDIQVASNFERYLFFYHNKNSQQVKKMMENFKENGEISLPTSKEGFDKNFEAFSCSDKDALEIIREYYQKEKYLLDPHTATSVYAAKQLKNQQYKTICLATAHPSKFPQAIQEAIGEDIAKHSILEEIKNKDTRSVTLSADKNDVKQYIIQNT